MGTRYLLLFLALTTLICELFLAVDVTAGQKAMGLDGRACSVNFSKSVPGQLNYQGFLVNAGDTSVVTATLEMTFRLFDSETKGAELWSETHPAVEVSNGLFQVLLGSVTPFSDSFFDGSDMWLQTEVGTEALSPRRPLASVAYSHRTNSAEMLEDNTLTDLDNRWVNEADLDHLDAADGDPAEALYVDDAGKVGIGTTSPLTELDVSGSVNATTYYGDGSNLTGIAGTPDADWTIDGDNVYHETGSVGIGTTSPAYPLDVSGNVHATAYYGDGSNLTGISGTSDNDWNVSGNDIYSALPGNVGIGTAAPAEKLHVVGNLRASGTIQSGSSITIDGINDRVTSSGGLELHVISGRALRLESHATSPNVIGGYSGNSVNEGIYGATIGGGGSSGNVNSVTGDYSTVGGGLGNTVSSDRAFVGGGQDNTVSSSFTAVGGGWNNQASQPYAVVCGGNNNTANGSDAFVGGGSGNAAGQSAFVGGGSGNIVSAEAGVIDGGVDNRVTDQYGTVGGGYINLAGDDAGTTDDANFATVGGGWDNWATGTYATIGGGWSNRASWYGATISGGGNNIANGFYTTVAGGEYNKADNNHASVGGGFLNFSEGFSATIGGGDYNYASGDYATIPGGSHNNAGGNYSFAAGRRAKANHHGCFVWADTTAENFSSDLGNQFKIRASNGMVVYGNNASYGALISNEPGGGDGLRVSADVSEGHFWGALFATNLGTSPAIFAYADTAGYFNGHVKVTGNIVKGGGGFQIDHPLDPENKYLYHSSVESQDMMNIYNGNAILDAQGETWVELPQWFEALNRDFRYQLTAIGTPGPNLYIAEKISDNRFKIAGGEPFREISWQVTGIRQDAFANAHRIPVENDKSGEERGKYLHAKEYGLPETMDIGYDAKMMKQNN